MGITGTEVVKDAAGQTMAFSTLCLSRLFIKVSPPAC